MLTRTLLPNGPKLASSPKFTFVTKKLGLRWFRQPSLLCFIHMTAKAFDFLNYFRDLLNLLTYIFILGNPVIELIIIRNAIERRAGGGEFVQSLLAHLHKLIVMASSPRRNQRVSMFITFAPVFNNSAYSQMILVTLARLDTMLVSATAGALAMQKAS